jgi:dihydrodipicolinate synthase/N-acetylneuraminate lyase
MLMKLVPSLTTPLLTPYNRCDLVDIGTLYETINYVRDRGVRSFVVLGTTGEALCASDDARHALVDQIPNLRGEDEYLMFGSGHEDVKKACIFTQLAVHKGADAVLVVTPDFWEKETIAHRPEDFETFYDEVLCVGCPTVIYSKPGARVLTAEWIEKMAERYGNNLLGAKSGDVGMLIEANKRLKGELYLSCGDDRYIWKAASNSLCATAGWSNCFPEEIKYIMDNGEAAPERTAELQLALTGLIGRTQDPSNFGGRTFHPVSLQKAAFAYIPAMRDVEIGEPKCYDPVPDEYADFLGKEIIRFKREAGRIMSEAG